MSLRLRLLEIVSGWLLDLGRWLAERLAAGYRRLRSLDNRRVSIGVVAVGFAVSVGSVVLGGFLPTPSGSVLRPLYALAVLTPLLGIAVALYAIRLASRSLSRPSGSRLGPPELDGSREADDAVGSEVERRLSKATDARYECRSTRFAEAVRADLTEGAVRVVRTRHGLSPAAAREAVRTGQWTDDPVAAGFLGEEARRPIGDRVRAVIDPGSAYRRRVRRTVAAIESLDSSAASPNVSPSSTPSSAAVTEVTE